MIKDRKRAAKRDEVGTLDFDPFVNAQDWEISAFDIAVTDKAPVPAVATVKFSNQGKPAVVSLELRHHQERVADPRHYLGDRRQAANPARAFCALSAVGRANGSAPAQRLERGEGN